MQIIGKLIQRNEPVTGTSQRGEWKKMEIIIETIETYPKKVCIICWNERVDEANAFELGKTLAIDISIESREYKYNGKYYTDVRAIRFDNSIQPQQNSQVQNYRQPVNQDYQQNQMQQTYPQQQNYMQQPQQQQMPGMPDNFYPPVDNDDDLPF